jgi:hypothetical protein
MSDVAGRAVSDVRWLANLSLLEGAIALFAIGAILIISGKFAWGILSLVAAAAALAAIWLDRFRDSSN